MNRVIYIRQGFSLRQGLNLYHGHQVCSGDDHPCIEVNVIFQDDGRCMECDRRIDCLVKPLKCLTHAAWHICNGDGAGVYYTPNYQGSGYFRDRTIEKVKGDEREFYTLTGLTFDDIVYKLHRV